MSRITQAEIISAISRQRRAGAINERFARAIRLYLDRHVQREYLIVEVTESIVIRAQDLLEKHPLRAFDAIQLACGLEGNARLQEAGLPDLIFVSADKRLLTAASAEGLAVDDPNAHP